MNARRMRIFLALGVAPVIGVLSAAFLMVQSNHDTHLVAHTLEVKNELAALLSSVQDVEGAQRGFLLTGEDELLGQICDNTVKVRDKYRRVLALVSDNSEQQSRIGSLQPFLEERLDTAANSVSLRGQGRPTPAEIKSTDVRGKLAMDHVRKGLADAQAAESVLFAQRRATYQNRYYWMASLLLISLFSAAGAAYGLIQQVASRSRDIEQANIQLESDQALLERKVFERTSAMQKERDRAESMLRDITHRVGNALSLVVGFLNLQIRHTKDVEAIKTLTSARERVMAIASAQRRMNVANDLELVRIDELVKGVLDDVGEAQAIQNIIINVEIPPLHAPAREATSLCVLIQEYVINAVKHAFPGDRAGEITVSLVPGDAGGALLVVADTGIGQSQPFKGSSGLGTQICERLVRQFDGTISQMSDRGLKVTITLPELSLSVPGEITQGAPA